MTSNSATPTAASEVSSPPLRVIVLGIGNTLCGDEGVGIHALDKLRKTIRFGEQVRLIDGGVMGLELVSYLENCDALLIIDAIDDAQAPGQLVRLEGAGVPATWEQKLSMHQAGLCDLLASLRFQDMMPTRLVVWGVQPATLEWSLEMSPVVQSVFDELVKKIVDELRTWGAIVD